MYLEIRYKDSKNTNSVDEGNMFQDFVTDILVERCGLVISNYASKKYQFEKGENKQGFEIKLDNRCTETKRLSIEIAEKTAIENSFVPSGIYRNDNSIFYVHGNFNIIFVFQKNLLKLLHQSGRYKEDETATIKKFYLPIKDAMKYAAVYFEINN